MYLPFINRFTSTVNQLPKYIKSIKSLGMIPIIDPINENPDNSSQNFLNIKNTIKKYPNNYYALKLSSLDINNKGIGVINETHKLCEYAIKNNSKIFIDAEYFTINKDIDLIADELMEEFNKNDINIYKTYQMYRKDTMQNFLHDLKKERNYYLGCKLVRGAYYNTDLKHNILFNNITYTHNAYNEAIKYFTYYSKNNDKLLCATHNKFSNDLAKEYISSGHTNVSMGHLLGMSDTLSNNLVKENIEVFKYLPYGSPIDTFPYLLRRLHENYSVIKYLF